MRQYISHEECLAIILQQYRCNPKLFIAIGGLSRSGKSTFIHWTQQKLETEDISSTIIPLDYWILPIEKRTPAMNVRDRYQYNQLLNDLTLLINNGDLLFLPYDSTSRSTSLDKIYISIKEKDIVFIDGVIALDHPLINEISTLKIFIDVDEEIRKKRFADFYRSKHLSNHSIQNLFQERQEDEYPFVIKSGKNADYIIH